MKNLFLFVLLVSASIAIVTVGCSKKTVAIPNNPPTHVPVTAPANPRPAPNPSLSTATFLLDQLELAKSSLQRGNYEEAVGIYERILRENPGEHKAQVALYELALLYASPGNPARNLALARSYLDRLARDYPKGAYQLEVQTLLNLIAHLTDTESNLTQLKNAMRAQDQTVKKLQSDLERVQDELNRLKAIDLKAKRKK